MTRSIKLNETVQSVIETDVIEQAMNPDWFGLDEEEAFLYQNLLDYLSAGLERLIIPDTLQESDAIAALLTDLSNGYDDAVEYEISDDPKFDKRAGRSLCTLAGNVRKIAAKRASG